jgi:two-component system sensor histidine kinase AlgZ
MFDGWDRAIAKFALSYGILFFFLIYFDWREKNLHPSQLQAQLSFLQSKMRPHFLFNTLNSIVSLIKRDPDTAKKMLLNLSELLRASLREENTFMHSLNQEIILCKKYLEIEKMRLGDRLEVIWDIQDNVEINLIPKLSLQPLIENSVLHGIQNLENGGLIEISIRKNLLSRIVVEIKNSQSKESSDLKEDGNKISMKNLIERLNICFDGDVTFKTKDNGDSFYVYLDVPIRLNQE